MKKTAKLFWQKVKETRKQQPAKMYGVLVGKTNKEVKHGI